MRKCAATRRRRTPATNDRVVGLIKDMAPRYGVPTWFALRIAKVESGYNPNTRGAAGEYGVYQMKCATAKGIGFSGNCAELLNASTNIRVRFEASADGHEAVAAAISSWRPQSIMAVWAARSWFIATLQWFFKPNQ